MPPIPIYSDKPIVAAKADGVTPQTANEPTPTRDEPSTLASNGTTSTYPAARPGVVAVPAPTASIPRPAPPPTRTTPQSLQSDYPPAPQPGAVPTPFSPPSQTSSLPPPPQAGSSPSPARTSQQQQPPPPVTTAPAQLSMAAPQQSYLPTSSTSTNASTYTPQRSGPTTLPLGDVPPSPAFPPPSSDPQYSTAEAHENRLGTPGPMRSIRSSVDVGRPKGYVQDPYAAEMTASQRASLEVQEKSERPVASYLSGIIDGPQDYGIGRRSVGSRDDGMGSGSGSNFGAGGAGGEEGEGVWGAVKGWMGTAGKKAQELEEEVWRRVNGDS